MVSFGRRSFGKGYSKTTKYVGGAALIAFAASVAYKMGWIGGKIKNRTDVVKFLKGIDVEVFPTDNNEELMNTLKGLESGSSPLSEKLTAEQKQQAARYVSTGVHFGRHGRKRGSKKKRSSKRRKSRSRRRRRSSRKTRRRRRSRS